MIFCRPKKEEAVCKKSSRGGGGEELEEKREGKSHFGSQSCDRVVTTHSMTVMRTHLAAQSENGFESAVCVVTGGVSRGWGGEKKYRLTLNPGYHSYRQIVFRF